MRSQVNDPRIEQQISVYFQDLLKWIIRGEIHRLSGVWKSLFRFIGNRDSVKQEIILFLIPYNEDMHPMV